MTLIVNHPYVSHSFEVSRSKKGDNHVVSCSASGEFKIHHPGKLQVLPRASYGVQIKRPPELGGTGTWEATKTVGLEPLNLEIEKPDGTPFTGNQITLADLNQFRDLRGVSHGTWKYRVHGKVEAKNTPSLSMRFFAGDGNITIGLEETVTSKSAPPLIDETLTDKSRRYKFDIFRVGTFNATAKASLALGPVFMQLLNPDGVVVAKSGNGRLTFPVTLRTLDKSRDANGNPRLWSLEVVATKTTPLPGIVIKVFASVIQTTRIRTSVLQERIDKLIINGGSNLEIFGQVRDSRLLARLRILDAFTAETIDMHDLLGKVIDSETQDAGVTSDIEAGKIYTLYSRSSEPGFETHISLDNLKVVGINIEIGASEKIQPSVPAVKVKVFTQGKATLKLGPLSLATAKIRDNLIHLETGVRLGPNGTFIGETWIVEDLLDTDVHWTTVLGLGLAHPLVALGAAGVGELIEEYLTDFITDGLATVWSRVVEKAPEALARIVGDDFTYRSLRLDGDDILFEYVAPLEPEPKPSKKHEYVGVIGRSVIGPGQVVPPLGDTWSVPNLTKNIDHIVVVMMENRSFDHVLGYRAQIKGVEGSDGLSKRVINLLQLLKGPAGEEIKFRKLKDSSFITPTKLPNGVEKKTKFPRSVPHDLAAMTQQLAEKTKIPFPGQDPTKKKQFRTINSPLSFIASYKERKGLEWEEALDVLGYYEGDDLPFYKFLAENYAFCEQFFCSHTGPTLPNRMYMLSGDVQYDRTGEAILDNNHGDNFFLSRAMTIFDLLERKGIRWRVYESFPSVAMLRMFARYATDNVNILPISQLEADIAKEKENFPAVTFIEPAMHHFPPNDDHAPDADMWRGQCFLQDVYDALRSEEKLWQKTMLVITYDEHGGFYDHLNPPIADMLIREGEILGDPNPGGHFTPSPLTINYGARVPTFIVSPWSPIGEGPGLVLDFCSILKTIAARFCGPGKPFISARVNASKSLDAYVAEAKPRMDVKDMAKLPLPLPEESPHPERSIITDPISRKQMRSSNVDYHDLTGMLARQLGR